MIKKILKIIIKKGIDNNSDVMVFDSGNEIRIDESGYNDLLEGIVKEIIEKNIVIPFYWTETDKGKKIIDEESMKEEFEQELKEKENLTKEQKENKI